ncbi:MAG: hypothetical protein WBL74_00925 [Novosphingobium sp.]|uniref:hypothetical protein n=1 Tax=Novosphingobium sp. TaxID=1874826 RepID=UPI003C7D4AD8
MDVEKVIAALEKYLREFIVYLVTFFRPTVTEEIYDDHENYNKSVIFAIFSTAIGAYMWSRYILQEPNNTKDIFGLMIDSMLMWVSFGILLFVIIRLFGREVPIVRTVISVVKVFSVAHVIGIYTAYIALGATVLFSTIDCAKEHSAATSMASAYLIELAILFIYMPRELKQILGPNLSKRRRWPINLTFMAALTFAQLSILAVSEMKLPEGSHRCSIDFGRVLSGESDE